MNKKFIFQQSDDDTMDLHVYSAYQALQEYLWLHPDEEDEISKKIIIDPCALSEDDFDDSLLIPVGSIEFCEEILKRRYGLDHIKPINIPFQLAQREFLDRQIMYINSQQLLDKILAGKTVLSPYHLFIKRADRCKAAEPVFFNCQMEKGCLNPKVMQLDFSQKQRYLVSEVIDIKSEWRAFVWRGEILDIRQYSGDLWVFPDRKTVERMVSAFNNSPKAYTLDVAVLSSGQTVVVEVHNFVSCGLYGFDSVKIPSMLAAAVRHELGGKLCEK